MIFFCGEYPYDGIQTLHKQISVLVFLDAQKKFYSFLTDFPFSEYLYLLQVTVLTVFISLSWIWVTENIQDIPCRVSLHPYSSLSPSTGIISSDSFTEDAHSSSLTPLLNTAPQLSSSAVFSSQESPPHFSVMGRRGIVYFSFQELFILLELHFSPKSQINQLFLHSNNPSVC